MFYCILFVLIGITGCHDKQWDDYYSRPSWLAGPIYQQLEAEGRFTYYLKCLQKTGFSEILGKTGYFTVFAPNDSAFEVFLDGRSLDDLDSLTLTNIVRYSLMQGGFSKKQLSSWQNGSGWTDNYAFKRSTYSNLEFYADSIHYYGVTIPIYVSNANNKNVPYFIDSYLVTQKLTNEDVTFFYPNASFDGFNVMDANVVKADIVAENGYIHEVNKVLLPLKNIDGVLSANADYSMFKSLLDMYVSLSYDSASTSLLAKKYAISLPAYSKGYSSSLSFSPTDENWVSGTNTNQTGGWTLFAPNNTAMLKFYQERLLAHYHSIPEIEYLKPQILIDFINSNMFKKPVWKSKFNDVTNVFGEYVLLNAASDIVKAEVASNGFFYGTNTVMRSSTFYSVYGEIYLNPSLMISLYTADKNQMRSTLSSDDLQYTAFLLPDRYYSDNGYSLVKTLSGSDSMVYADVTVNTSDNLATLFKRHIVRNRKIDLSGSGYAETMDGTPIGWSNGAVFAGGNVEKSQAITPTAQVNDLNNGSAYYLNVALKEAVKEAGEYIVNKPEYSAFKDYLKYAGLLTDYNIADVVAGSVKYTFLIPDNDALRSAGLPELKDTMSTDDKNTIKRFLYYHIVPNLYFFTDGRYQADSIATMSQIAGSSYKVYNKICVKYSLDTVRILDRKGNLVPVLPDASSNVLAKKAVIHHLKGVLRFQ
jgi:uncharacterized surface protein with fasciclin (FAS1) repeats